MKGPQGTLFGKNTASGALQFLTVKPNLDATEGFIEVQGGSESFYHVKGAANIPIVEGTSAFRLTGGVTHRDGYMENIATGSDLNDRDRFNLRVQYLHDSEGFSARINVATAYGHSERFTYVTHAKTIYNGGGGESSFPAQHQGITLP